MSILKGLEKLVNGKSLSGPNHLLLRAAKGPRIYLIGSPEIDHIYPLPGIRRHITKLQSYLTSNPSKAYSL